MNRTTKRQFLNAIDAEDDDKVLRLVEGIDLRVVWLPLHYAIEKGKVSIVQKLLESGADPNLPSTNGCTPLLAATMKSNWSVIHELLKYGADPNRSDEDG